MNLVVMLKKRDMLHTCSKLSVKNVRKAIKVDFQCLSPSNKESWHIQAGTTFDYNCT